MLMPSFITIYHYLVHKIYKTLFKINSFSFKQPKGQHQMWCRKPMRQQHSEHKWWCQTFSCSIWTFQRPRISLIRYNAKRSNAWPGKFQRITLSECLSSKLISLLEPLKGQFQILCFLPSTPLHSVTWFVDTLALTISTRMTASCVCPLNQTSAAALNGFQPCLASVQSWINRNWNQIKLKSSSSRVNESGANIFMFRLELFCVKSNLEKSAQNLWVIFDNNFAFRLQIFAVCSSCLYHTGDLWHIHRYLDLDSAKLLTCKRSGI